MATKVKLATQLMGKLLGCLEDLDEPELKALCDAVVREQRQKFRQRAFDVTRTLRVGDRVEWDSRRGGGVMRARVQSIGPKNVKCKTDEQFGGALWTVTATLLRKVKGK